MMKNLGLATLVLGMFFAVIVGHSRESAAQAQQPTSRVAGGSTELTLDLGNKVTLKLVEIPAGKFLMGSPETEKERDTDEDQHDVTISRPFYMGVTHVTVDQFAAFVQDSGYKTDAEKDGWSNGFEVKDGKLEFKKVEGCSWRNPSFDQKGDHPVVQVSWNDAKAFCDWLTKKSGKTVVLPTEAQWEYACRAGTKTAYHWGEGPEDGKGWTNCRDQSLKKKLPNAPAKATFFNWDDGFQFTAPAGSFKANSFGLYDMTGNAWQWCQDRYQDYEKGLATDPTGAESGGSRVVRGGSWYTGPQNCRSAIRVTSFPGYRCADVGFRVAVGPGGVAFKKESRGEAQQPGTGGAAGQEMILDLGDKVTLKLVRIPAGKFLMGSPETEKGRRKGEVQHEVTISKPFYMGVTHVTLDQFAVFVRDSGYKTDAEKERAPWGFEILEGKPARKEVEGRSWRDPGFDQEGNHPVVVVSWNDAKAFCDWISKKTGKAVVLPTEAQWEYACRAGTKTAYPWGEDPDDGKGWGNCSDQSLKKKLPKAPVEWGFFSWDDGFVFTSPVGSFKPNAFGLYDMTGNASHRCQDRFGVYGNGAATDPTGAGTGGVRVCRGGSWGKEPALCRSANRDFALPDSYSEDGGFRVVVAEGRD